MIKYPGSWSIEDMDCILQQGDELYQTTPRPSNNNYLPVEELPAKSGNVSMKIKYMMIHDHIM